MSALVAEHFIDEEGNRCVGIGLKALCEGCLEDAVFFMLCVRWFADFVLDAAGQRRHAVHDGEPMSEAPNRLD